MKPVALKFVKGTRHGASGFAPAGEVGGTVWVGSQEIALQAASTNRPNELPANRISL
jgi:hypothetical protein